MIEVLVAMIIIAVGLLGLAGLQARAQRVELESYQRVQALIMVDDMAQRVRANREAARCYEITNADGFIGAGNEPAACAGWGTSSSRALADADLQQWDDLLEGSAETRGTDNVGGMTGARGCIDYDGTGTNDVYTISVAWQGEVETQAPTPGCGAGKYGNAKLRRVVTRTIEFPVLD